jgi:two-component system, OmpR family, response regulator CpxR
MGSPPPCTSILLVEDDADTRAMIRHILERRGYPVMEARHGAEALEQLRSIPEPCLILLDLMMPVMNGEELLAALREKDVLATIPVVVVSAYDTRAKHLAGTAGHVKKPMDLASLLAFVRRHCGEPRGSATAGTSSARELE